MYVDAIILSSTHLFVLISLPFLVVLKTDVHCDLCTYVCVCTCTYVYVCMYVCMYVEAMILSSTHLFVLFLSRI
jgi:hypothetical protein